MVEASSFEHAHTTQTTQNHRETEKKHKEARTYGRGRELRTPRRYEVKDTGSFTWLCRHRNALAKMERTEKQNKRRRRSEARTTETEASGWRRFAREAYGGGRTVDEESGNGGCVEREETRFT
ncbi:hypothetical protein IGI04_018024 [Brassica rapa subsp. trilocularis]|uniref:Uncharacterized protein n=1 Tax=Brassica rapa subsp. trilocularis TaxID=1813537 RepID=A0ABQ7MBR1_BRACM|nr:hypothetical protein IGI04_018024 [Brassica rapa subsp. trilocularis]